MTISPFDIESLIVEVIPDRSSNVYIYISIARVVLAQGIAVGSAL